MFAESDEEDFRDTEQSRVVEDYRTFRRRRFDRASGDVVTIFGVDDDAPLTMHPLGQAKEQMRRARASLLSAQMFPSEARELSQDHVLRMLKVPSSCLPKERTWWRSTGYFLASVLPARFCAAWLRERLREIGSYEGRKFAVERSIGCVLCPARYTPAVDYILRNLEVSGHGNVIKDLEDYSPQWIATMLRLGAVDATSVRSALSTTPRLKAHTQQLIFLLVRAGVLTSMTEIVSWREEKYTSVSYGRHDASFVYAARRVIEQLVACKADRLDILDACQGDVEFLPARLANNIVALNSRGLSPSSALASGGSLLWTAETKRWVFLLDELKVRDESAFGQFKSFLKGRGAGPLEIARALVASGATVPQLAACQEVFSLASSYGRNPTAAQAWAVLHQAGFSIDDFSHARCFLSAPGDLPDFLAVLRTHGLASPEQILCFDQAFNSVASTDLDALLQVAMPRKGDEPLSKVAGWVRRAASPSITIKTTVALASLIRLRDLDDLERVLKFVHLGPDLMYYLVKDKALSTYGQLKDWFFKTANVVGLKPIGKIGPIERVILNDAYARANFGYVRHNGDCAWRALLRRADSLLGPRPHSAPLSERQAYDAAHASAVDAGRPQLLIDMKRVLDATGGVLYASLLAEPNLSTHELEARLANAAPLLDELVAGRGPCTLAISEVEREAIALVYRSDASTVEEHWQHVVGREKDVAALKLAPAYPMRWQRTRPTLSGSTPLDKTGFKRLAAIARQALDFARSGAALGDALVGVVPERLAHRATDLYGMAPHLTVLCCWLANDPHVRPTLELWTLGPDRLLSDVEAHRLVLDAESFFATTLPDVLDERLPAMIAAMSDDTAASLAQRLGRPGQGVSAGAPKEQLSASLALTCDKVRSLFGKWITSQKKLFTSVTDDGAFTACSAVISKAPAAFYAKTAARLCTRDDTDMWEEERLSHVVVFDPAARRLVGMAIMYVQSLREVDRERQTVVIRAINPMEEIASTHGVASIIDAFVEVAIKVAHENDLAAVAIPGGDSHLLSNIKSCEDELIARRSSLAEGLYLGLEPPLRAGLKRRPERVGTQFDGYAQGKKIVSEVFVIWGRTGPGIGAASSFAPS